jgi:membrane-bound inhibitor of C-type lysozyme
MQLTKIKRIKLMLGLLGSVWTLSASDLTIHLPDTLAITRQTVTYQCDATGSTIGVPAGQFKEEYINGGGNSLVVVPILGNSLIFSNVSSGSGARCTAQQYTWWKPRAR